MYVCRHSLLHGIMVSCEPHREGVVMLGGKRALTCSHGASTREGDAFAMRGSGACAMCHDHLDLLFSRRVQQQDYGQQQHRLGKSGLQDSRITGFLDFRSSGLQDAMTP